MKFFPNRYGLVCTALCRNVQKVLKSFNISEKMYFRKKEDEKMKKMKKDEKRK